MDANFATELIKSGAEDFLLLPPDPEALEHKVKRALGEAAGTPITARARLIPGLRSAPDGSIRFAVEYWLLRPIEKERFRRYWVEAQRRMRRPRK